MADEADLGNETAEQSLRAWIGAVRRREPLRAIGACHNCGEAVSDPERFCGVECRADYDYRKTIDRRTKGPNA